MSSSATEGPSLGVCVSLPPGTLAAQRERELTRRQQQQQQQQQQQTQEKLSQHVLDDEEDQQFQENDDEGPRPIGIDLDREIVPFQLGDGGGNDGNDDDGDSTLGAGSNSDADLQDDAAASDDDDDDDDDDYEEDDDEISQSPPTSLPLLSIDLVELTGCTPSNAEEKTMLVEQVRGILVGPSEEQNQDDAGGTDEETEKNEEEPLWAQFNAKSVELFNMGAASHGDTAIPLGEDDLRRCYIEYPEFLPVPVPEQDNGEGATTTVVMPTSRMWKILTSSHRIAPVDRILVHLSQTSRDLVWRYMMNQELRHLARSEQQECDRRHRAAALEEWTFGGRRKLELERLYQVRETFEYRLNAARKSWGEVVGRREDRVRSELARRREAGISGGGVDGLDWAEGAATFVFGDEEQEQHPKLRDIAPSSDLAPMTAPYQDRYGDIGSDASSSNEESGYELDDEDSLADGESDMDEHSGPEDATQSKTSEKLAQSRSEARAERRRKRAAKSSKRMRKKLALQEEEAKRRSMIEAAKAEERDIRRMCTQPEEELAKAVVDQLEERMAKIDALLEKIQDEEWAEEEGDGGTKCGLQIDVLYDDLDEERHHRPLLDQILAMILGAARPSEGRTKEEHFRFIKDEHQSIVSDWWNYFGRLPPSLAEKEESAAKEKQVTNTPAQTEETLLVAGALTALRFDDDRGAPKKSSLPDVSAKQTPEAMRSMLGIADNDGDDWDDVDDWGAFGFAEESTAAPIAAPEEEKELRPKKAELKKVGLRPGGKML